VITGTDPFDGAGVAPSSEAVGGGISFLSDVIKWDATRIGNS
jgi:hypothetical protein